jgi:hypothetical protein
MWDERIDGMTDKVDVKFRETFGVAKLYDPTQGAAAIQTLTNTNAISLTLSNHPVIVELAER